MSDQNDQLILISGESATGKSASLLNIRNQEKWFYLGCEAGKRLPFKNKFQNFRIEDPYQVHEALDFAKDNPDVEGIIIDTLDFLMDMFETQYVLASANTQKAWGDYAQFFKIMMQQKIVSFGKPVIILAHTRSDLDEAAMEMKTSVPIKGSLKGNGIESFFSTVVSTKKISLKDLSKTSYDSKFLHITEEDELVGYKHVFQTRLTAATKGERIRSPMGMFSKEQTYTDNDAQLLLDYLTEYYK